MKGSGATTSVWMETTEMGITQTLTRDMTTDVCVVGAGISGLTTAYLLASEGQSVLVLDGGRIGSGETSRTTAHLSNALDDRYYKLRRLHGERGAQLAAESHSKAIDTIEVIVTKENIACQFERVDGYLFVPHGESKDVLDQELEAAHGAGLTSVERVPRAPLEGLDTGPCLRFPRQAQFHPLKYVEALANEQEACLTPLLLAYRARGKASSPLTTRDPWAYKVLADNANVVARRIALVKFRLQRKMPAWFH